MKVIAILLLMLGLINIFAKDLAWKFTEFFNRLRGNAAERSDTWETGSTIGGVFLIAIALVLFLQG